MQNNMKNTRQTALITGPTSGIGEQFAIKLAESGHDLILVSRDEEKLRKMCLDLSQAYGIKAHKIVADLSKSASPEEVFEKVNQLDIQVDILINNAGFQIYDPFHSADWKATQKLIDVNVNALVNLTHLFLPGMIQRKEGYILNMGSLGSFAPGPNNAVYTAGKAFVLNFSEAIAEELRGTGVHVTCLCPGPVDTPFAERADITNTFLFKYFAMPPGPVAEAGIKAMLKKQRVSVPGIINKLIVFFLRFVPRRLVTRIAKYALLPD